MTLKEMFENMLIETKKTDSPHIHIEDFNFYANKVQFQYINERYNVFEINQQSTDDLSKLKTNVFIDIAGVTGTATMSTGLINNHYINPTLVVTPVYNNMGIKFNLPNDYFHITNCIVHFTVGSQKDCYSVGDVVPFPVKRITDDQYAAIVTNPYLAPSYRRPYYLINDNPTISTSMFNPGLSHLVDGANNAEISILIGNNPKFTISRVEISYIRVPKRLILTYAQAFNNTLSGGPTDSSQVLEFPPYVCYELNNRLNTLLMERALDPRTANYVQANTTIAPPQQAQG